MIWILEFNVLISQAEYTTSIAVFREILGTIYHHAPHSGHQEIDKCLYIMFYGHLCYYFRKKIKIK